MNKPLDPLILYSTFDHIERARDVARLIVQQHLGACCNLIPSCKSIYIWEGELVEDEEVILIVKTVYQHQAALIDLIAAHHSYDEPAIFSLPIVGGSESYLSWALNQVKKEAL